MLITAPPIRDSDVICNTIPPPHGYSKGVGDHILTLFGYGL